MAAGQWDKADAIAGKGLGLDAPPACAAELSAIRAEIVLARGNPEQARTELSRAPDTVAVAHQQAELALHENRVEDARHHVAEALAAAQDAGEPARIWAILATGARVESAARLRARNPAAQRGELLSELQAAGQLPADTPVLSAYAAGAGRGCLAGCCRGMGRDRLALPERICPIAHGPGRSRWR